LAKGTSHEAPNDAAGCSVNALKYNNNNNNNNNNTWNVKVEAIPLIISGYNHRCAWKPVKTISETFRSHAL
jgi:hypothetical protein